MVQESKPILKVHFGWLRWFLGCSDFAADFGRLSLAELTDRHCVGMLATRPGWLHNWFYVIAIGMPVTKLILKSSIDAGGLHTAARHFKRLNLLFFHKLWVRCHGCGMSCSKEEISGRRAYLACHSVSLRALLSLSVTNIYNNSHKGNSRLASRPVQPTHG